MKIRYLKVLRDLTSDYPKNLMLVLAIAIGVFGIGSILGGYAVVKREMAVNYLGTQPASATIELEEGISRELVDRVKTLPGIQEADRRATLQARMKIHDKWYPLLLFVIDDFRKLRISKFNHVSGDTEPALGAMLAERTALGMMDAGEGAEITIKTQNGSPKLIRITGTVHDPGLAPAWQEQAGYGYITLATLHWLGESQNFDQLKIKVNTQENSRQHITQQAKAVAAWLTKEGYAIHEIQVPPPNRHPHQGQMNAVMSIFIVFSFLILILASILVATSMATLMVKHIRQIGVMKTIGANSGQIARLYLFMMFLLCLAALSIGIPFSWLAASIFYTKIAVLLNIDLTDRSIPNWVFLVQMGTGIIIPVLAVSVPVIRGSRLSVRSAMDHYGLSQTSSLHSNWVTRLTQARFLGDTLKLSLRNAFRQRSRLGMTLGLLAAGGATFMTAMNVSEAWTNNLRRIYTQRLYDLEIRLNQPIQAETLVEKLKNIPGVKIVERGNYAPASFLKDGPYSITQTYPDKGHGSFTIQAIPIPTRLLKPTLLEGNWLSKRNATDVVLNQLARAVSPGIKLGDTLTLSVDGKATTWNVIGFTEDVGSPATAYVSSDAFARYMATDGRSTSLRIAFMDRNKAYAADKTRAVEKVLERDNIPVRSSVPVWLLHNAIAGHMKILINSLLAMAILMALVGTLGLLSTMSMNVMERTREIGVMRAIGATPRKIRNLIVWEGLAIGAISIVLAFGFSLLLSTYLGRFIGNMAFRTQLGLIISPLACSIWVGIIIAGSYLATLFPARRANKLTTREALAYE
ncbi:FtsX-like permease family protein [Spirosoma aureum]|uniref:FtsX-like permease family protein n=1 Tax=Spirosoma aureum TaxID=2692134 RepID=A0A6G9AL52_9BACT|nr:FtsX-like permease family protein [Spirosoma aureum]QIP13177.1 FtsX-like permease family protein [Spirosoma aureum]